MTEPGDVRILLVDDIAEIREMLALSFELRDGFTVVGQADNGEKAVGLAASLQPDVVLLDVAMPGMDGISALPLIREVAPNTRVVMLSGYDAREADAWSAGADGYLLKGARMAEIANEIVRVLARQGSQVPDGRDAKDNQVGHLIRPPQGG